MMFGSAIAPWFLRKIKDERLSLVLCQLVIGVGIFLTVVFRNLTPALATYLIHEMARGMYNPLRDAYLNNNIPSKERATLISFGSISHHLGGMVGLLASGAMAEYMSIPTAWIVSGLILVITALFMLKSEKRN